MRTEQFHLTHYLYGYNWNHSIFTACKRSLGQGNIFRSMCQEFCPRGGGWYPSMPCKYPGGSYPSMPCRSPGLNPRGKLRGLAWGGGSPGPHPWGKLRGRACGGLHTHTWGSPGPHLAGVSRATPRGGISRPTPGYPSMHWGRPPNRQLLLWVVCILLECILVGISLSKARLYISVTTPFCQLQGLVTVSRKKVFWVQITSKTYNFEVSLWNIKLPLTSRYSFVLFFTYFGNG